MDCQHRRSDKCCYVYTDLAHPDPTTKGPSDIMKEISDTVSHHVLSHAAADRFSPHSSTITIEMRLSLDWDLIEFVRQQQYDLEGDHKVLERAICLTGTWCKAHATTPLEYLQQTWPSTDRDLYKVLRKFLSSGKPSIISKYQAPGAWS